MIYRVRHVTRYAYETPVDLATHLVHLTPRAASGQEVVRSTLLVDPPASRRTDGTDYFGNPIACLFHEEPHTSFVLTAVSDVSVAPTRSLTPGPAWESVVRAVRHDASAWQAAEFTLASPACPVSARAGEWVATSFTPGRPIGDAVMHLTRRIYTDFSFRAGVTGLATTIDEILDGRAGVCQDFTNLMISGLRWLGVPARYISGYIRTYPRGDAAQLLGADQSHAWVGVWLGPEMGWVGFDPTNGILGGGEHVITAYGRDYRDISPVRGMILGGGRGSMSVEVDLLPCDEAQARGVLFPEEKRPAPG
ncbi:putative cysteine protease [Ameyamaea chiangmaiensis NBRC 103196]|uniref:Transglutaminase family protein n=1 Tax=Ameyamaea chiangmaiensis TaxID=442969 RepID=A0A850PEB4_9PROT|nr:transglutaminase family protein [Ameyamaea chiangmaiensis]MBS4074043.1 transglutaminase family protein [Ameyamaea chiangmaiensis]NVN39401.1 transglutaminase family protein [Ameyamaea chiangmaiensis]GBQ67463.1 putative cysteine protease [Ameyamaea chiangmaiensis NBRC 103196]